MNNEYVSDLWDLELSTETMERLKKHPDLFSIVQATISHPAHTLELSKLCIWYRERYEEHQEELMEMFGWTDETQEEFWSWGHNSRWANVFEPMMFNNFDEYVDTAIDILEDEYEEQEDDAD